MATWFAQNSSVNIDSVNEWNSAANGSGSWLTWASLGASDILVANGKTAIAINVNVTCATLTTAATGGTAGGGFTLSAGVNITANIECGTTTCVTRSAAGGSNCLITGNLTGSTTTGSVSAYSHSSTGTTNITGNVTGGTSGGFGATVSNGTVNITGNVTGGGTGNLSHGISYSAGSLAVTGNVTGGTQIYSYGINAAASLSVVITGDIIPSATTPAIGLVGTGSGTTTILHTGNIQASSAGIVPFGGSHKYLLHATNALQHSYYTNNSGVPGVPRSLYTGGVNLGQPVVANVRSGTVYGAASEYTGTLAVPSPTLVAIGVSTDNTVGSYAPTGGLDAAGVRTAIGLATANLDTQLSGIQSDTNDIQTRLPAALESGRIAAALDSPTQTQIDNIEATLTTLGSESTTVERSVSDTNAITFSWPVSGATITGTASLNNGTYGAVAGAIAFLRTETGRHYYTLAYNAADRPSAEGQVRYKLVDGTYTGYVVLRTVTTVLADAAHGGAAATLVLSTIDIQPASADTPGVLIRGTGSAAGVDVKGGEYADGIKARSGDTSGYGICSNGVQGGARFWSTNGYGVRVSSDNSNAFSIYGGTYAFQINSVNNAIDVYSSTGNAVYLQSAQNDAVVIYPGADDIGVHIWGGQTSGDAVALDSNGSGSVVYPTSGGGGGGEGSASYEAVVVTRMPVGVTVGWPTELVIGDAYLTETLTAPKLFIRDIEDNVLAGLGSKAFSDGDFVGKLRLAPLTTSTRDSSLPAATVEVSSDDTPGIVFNDDTADAEYFELQIPHEKTILGVVKTEYAAQFIMNWGADRTYERTVNLGKIKFIRKTSAAT